MTEKEGKIITDTSEAEAHTWPSVTYETLPWHNDPDALLGISKTARRRIASTYEAAIPAKIASLTPQLPSDLIERMGEVALLLARFDIAQTARGYNLPALLLRSESAASSQIEQLTSSARNIALAEISSKVPKNAQLITGNIAAMRKALSINAPLTLQGILDIHSALINQEGVSFGGKLRDEQVWVGGYPFSPHSALFVPPAAPRVPALLKDAIAFANRQDVNTVAQAAILHAQFETIHPFIDGNGRTGRTLLHIMLKQEGVLSCATLPLSAGLLHNVDAYMQAIKSYQGGDISPIVNQLTGALELAVSLGNLAAVRVDEVIEEWKDQITERSGSAIWQLPNLLIEQPVVDTAYVSTKLGITQRAALSLLDRACEYGIVRAAGNFHRGSFYQADALIEVLDQISDISEIRRVLGKGGL